MARPTKLTLELQEEICNYIRQGNYISTVCDYCLVPSMSLTANRKHAQQLRFAALYLLRPRCLHLVSFMGISDLLYHRDYFHAS